MRRDIRNSNGRLLGTLQWVNGRIILRGRASEFLGSFDIETRQTRDGRGFLVGTGVNLLPALLGQAVARSLASNAVFPTGCG